ncbi:MAG: DUF1295 domain-containing protein [Verrucomicrobia bacterium]|nr:DUF1295 domain-containing protein [Verrucomicrobiota bacterium]
MTVLTLLGMATAIGLLVMTGLCVVALRTRNLGWVDVGWTGALGLVAVMAYATAQGHATRRLVVAALMLTWAGRLVALMLKRLIHRPEDGRYQALRNAMGARWQGWTTLLFAVEVPLIPIFSLPMLVIMNDPATWGSGWDVAGLLLWLLAFAGEAVADNQLDRFRAKPENANKTCREGFWRYSRHPNYFFEWLLWWAYAVMAIPAPSGWVVWVVPPLMLIFLVKLTGIPHAERQALARRGDDYRRYQAATSRFIPWFPRRETSP